MGVWGTGIFQDDTACDIRDGYVGHLGEGLSGSEAAARILAGFESSFADPEESCVAWLALAAVQWQHGRLDAGTLEHALDVIDSGADLRRWESGSKDLSARKAALDALRKKIASPQPAEKKVAPRKREECTWKVGDLVAYRLLSGKRIVFCVIGHHRDDGGRYPVCELLDWVGSEIPSAETLEPAGTMRSRPDPRHTVTQIMLVGQNRKFAARVEELGMSLKPSQKSGRSSVVHSKFLDKFLKDWFLLE